MEPDRDERRMSPFALAGATSGTQPKTGAISGPAASTLTDGPDIGMAPSPVDDGHSSGRTPHEALLPARLPAFWNTPRRPVGDRTRGSACDRSEPGRRPRPRPRPALFAP